jgi:hypothetical protein
MPKVTIKSKLQQQRHPSEGWDPEPADYDIGFDDIKNSIHKCCLLLTGKK